MALDFTLPARARGRYTPHLPEAWGGLGIGPLGMALISQECGVSGLASLGLNAIAPDAGNMHTLLIAGTDEQLETYLRPLAEGRVRSCFAMTEPDVAGSDPSRPTRPAGGSCAGASEMHRTVVARDMLKLAAQGESVRAACGEL